MDKFKNFLYDKNDIVIALIIVAIAAVIITGRIDAIMAYPDQMAAEAAAQSGQEGDGEEAAGSGASDSDAASGAGSTQAGADGTAPSSVYPAPESGSIYPASTDNSADDGNSSDNTGETGNGETGEPETPPAVTNITVTIPSGTTGDGIAQILLSSGLITQKSEFTNAVAAAGADRNLKAGTFIVPSNATPSQIVSIITQ